MRRLCDPLSDNDDDISNFASSIAGNFMGVVQYNKDNRKFEVWGTNMNIQGSGNFSVLTAYEIPTQSPGIVCITNRIHI